MSSYNNRINTIILWGDMFIISISLVLTVLIFHPGNSFSNLVVVILMGGFLVTGWFFTSKNYNLYDEAARQSLISDFFKTGKNILFQAAFISIFLFVVKNPELDRKFVAVYILLISVLLLLQKIFFKKVLMFLSVKGSAKRRVLIVGAGDVGLNFQKILDSHPHLDYHVVGFLDDSPKTFLNGQCLGKISEVNDVLNSHKDIDEIVVALPNHATEGLKIIIQAARQATVRMRIIPDYFHYLSTKYAVSMFEGLPMISIRREPLEEFHWRVIKRLFDFFFSLLVLVFICSWLFPLLAICIKLDSKGPVFFTQMRTGRNKIPFKCIKFRSMRVNEQANSMQAKNNDSRLTRVGKFLRKTNLDEFPQFINVFKGQMAVVGPRPHMIKHTEQYAQLIDRYLVRHLLKSGITGWAQVNGHRGETRHPDEMKARVEHDVWYIENWTILFDIKIIMMTVWNIFKGDKKAY